MRPERPLKNMSKFQQNLCFRVKSIFLNVATELNYHQLSCHFDPLTLNYRFFIIIQPIFTIKLASCSFLTRRPEYTVCACLSFILYYRELSRIFIGNTKTSAQLCNRIQGESHDVTKLSDKYRTWPIYRRRQVF